MVVIGRYEENFLGEVVLTKKVTIMMTLDTLKLTQLSAARRRGVEEEPLVCSTVQSQAGQTILDLHCIPQTNLDLTFRLQEQVV